MPTPATPQYLPWIDLTRRIWADVASKLATVCLVMLAVGLGLDALMVPAVVVGLCSIAFHHYLLAFRCPRCRKRFAFGGFLVPDLTVFVPPRKCLHCGLKRGADFKPSEAAE